MRKEPQLSGLVSARRIRAVATRLQKAQGRFVPKHRRDALDELIMTVLSQHTSDVNSGRAFAGLKKRFPSWEEVLEAPASEVAAAIRPGGIAQIKAARIKEILREVEDREGRLTLNRLKKMPDGDVDGYLRSLPGVGPKTAACVMVFSMGRAAFPVDTHVHRVVARLGWVDGRASAELTQRTLGSVIPSEIRYELHMQLIRHGREICKPRMPLCTECVLFDFCEAGPRLLAEGDAR